MLKDVVSVEQQCAMTVAHHSQAGCKGLLHRLILRTRGRWKSGRETETTSSFTVKPQDVHRTLTLAMLQPNQLAKHDTCSR